MNRIAICAPSTPISQEDAANVSKLAASYPDVELTFHDQCFASDGHFAGNDSLRLSALLECANDSAFDAVWFARGGYGANRIAAEAIMKMDKSANSKTFLGYSDGGYLLAALYRSKTGVSVHGPMVVDVRREDGHTAVERVLSFFSGDRSGLEPNLNGHGHPTAAFNLMTLAMLCGTELMPDLSRHVIMVEEVSEHLYSVDRLFFHVTQHLRGIAGLRLGRISDVPENDRPFGSDPTEIASMWCGRVGIPFLGSADIGHDIANKIVPFGLAAEQTEQ